MTGAATTNHEKQRQGMPCLYPEHVLSTPCGGGLLRNKAIALSNT